MQDEIQNIFLYKVEKQQKALEKEKEARIFQTKQISTITKSLTLKLLKTE